MGSKRPQRLSRKEGGTDEQQSFITTAMKKKKERKREREKNKEDIKRDLKRQRNKRKI